SPIFKALTPGGTARHAAELDRTNLSNYCKPGNLAMAPVDVRKGMPSVELSREEFEKRFRSRFADPAFEALQRQLDAITAAAWEAYSDYRKSPRTRKAGPGFADPEYEISVDWLRARRVLLAPQRRPDEPWAAPPHPLF